MKKRPPDDDIVYLEENGGKDDVARALEEAERAVSAVERRHRRAEEAAEAADAEPEPELEIVPQPVSDALERELEELRGRLASAEEESGRMREVLLRKTADFDNLKRRTEREKSDYFKYALAETFRDLLAVVDNFHRATAHADSGGEEFRAGVVMIERQLGDVLKKYGLAEIPALGLAFDPNVHEAVVREETETVAPGTVLEVLQKGWILNDRLLRPALVKVAAAPSPQG